MSDSKVEALLDESPDCFGFLVTEYQFAGPTHLRPVGRPSWDRSHSIQFSSENLVVEVGLDPWAIELTTILRHPSGESRPVRLEDLYTSLAVGPAQDVPTRADTPHALRKHLRQQGAALAAVMERTRGTGQRGFGR